MRIMTSNIWGDYFGNEVSSREGQLYQIYQKYAPDIIGIQEATGGWYLGKTFERLEQDGYRFLGTHFLHPEQYSFVPGTPLYEGSNFVPLLIKAEKFKVLEFGFEFLRDTPDASKAITWAVLECKDCGKVFGVCNTHFWWMPRGKTDDDLRTENAKQLVALMNSIRQKHGCPVFAFGDMNTVRTSDAFEVYLHNGISVLQDEAENADRICTIHGNPERGEDGRFHGKQTTLPADHSIDHMIGLGGGYYVTEYRIIEDQDALDVTDHSPIYVDIMF